MFIQNNTIESNIESNIESDIESDIESNIESDSDSDNELDCEEFFYNNKTYYVDSKNNLIELDKNNEGVIIGKIENKSNFAQSNFAPVVAQSRTHEGSSVRENPSQVKVIFF